MSDDPHPDPLKIDVNGDPNMSITPRDVFYCGDQLDEYSHGCPGFDEIAPIQDSRHQAIIASRAFRWHAAQLGVAEFREQCHQEHLIDTAKKSCPSEYLSWRHSDSAAPWCDDELIELIACRESLAEDLARIGALLVRLAGGLKVEVPALCEYVALPNAVDPSGARQELIRLEAVARAALTDDRATGSTAAARSGPKRRGRKPRTNPEADRRIAEAWGTGEYHKHEDLAQTLIMGVNDVKKALDRHRKRHRK
ncbi:MAG: hypothetical protein JXA69_07570 [Phycisphaerae bacterium]|nr:hypothetical protein [Phycisphaerae bacterium]